MVIRVIDIVDARTILERAVNGADRLKATAAKTILEDKTLFNKYVKARVERRKNKLNAA